MRARLVGCDSTTACTAVILYAQKIRVEISILIATLIGGKVKGLFSTDSAQKLLELLEASEFTMNAVCGDERLSNRDAWTHLCGSARRPSASPSCEYMLIEWSMLAT